MTSTTTKNFWSDSFFARIYRKKAGKHFENIHKIVADYIAKNCSDARDVLDVACGPGDFLLYLSRQNSSLNLTGTDLAPGMIAYAQQQLSDKAAILLCDVHNMPFAVQSFDVITIMMAFHHMPDKQKILEKLKLLLRNGGMIIIVDPVARTGFQKHLWNFAEKVMRVRGFVEHYTRGDITTWTQNSGLIMTSYVMPGVNKRYSMVILQKA